MNSIPTDKILEFKEGALECIRKEYNLDGPGRVDEAIDLLEKWIKKQDHFNRKDFPRDYLERRLIFCKGLVERTKIKLDKSCTMRTLLPQFFHYVDVKSEYPESDVLLDAFLPKQTDDHYRVYVIRNVAERLSQNRLVFFYRLVMMMSEYILAHDYLKGVIIIFDYTQLNIMTLLKVLDITELRQAITILHEGYGFRVKAVHFITSSKLIEKVMFILQSILNPKIMTRVKVHKDFESLHKEVPRDILPIELGGKERSIRKLHEEWVNILNSKEYQDYFEEMKAACTNEEYRQDDKFIKEYMGTPGTFRTFNFD